MGEIPSDPSSGSSSAGATVELWEYFLTLILVLVFHRAIGSALNKIGVPRIIGDIIAGCCLGPTIMGPKANYALFPQDNRQLINMCGQFGLIMTSMNAGFSFDRRVLAGKFVHTIGYTFLNMAIPTLASVPLVYALPDSDRWRGSSSSFSFSSYFVLVACTMASSALPMVFLILDELKMKHRFAIGFSCLSTIGLFTMLSIASALAAPDLPPYMIAVRLLLLAVAIGLLMILQIGWHRVSGLKPILRLVSDNITLFVIAITLGSAVISERLGYTFLLGAFIAGAAMPFDVSLRAGLAEKVRWMTRWIFLPQFFVYAGLFFNLRDLNGSDIPYILLYLFLAFASKALLVPVTKWCIGLSWKEACFCASLANCRGFNALIIANEGKNLSQIGDAFYVTCVLLSVLSTSAAGPLAAYFKPLASSPDDQASPRHAHPHGTTRSPRTESQKRMVELRTATGTGTGTEETAADAGTEKIELKDAGLNIPSDGNDFEELDIDSQQGAMREDMFESWLSERNDTERGQVLVCFPEDVSGRMRDPRTGIPLEPGHEHEEPKFTGINCVDWLCRLYRIERRTLAVELAQRLLEVGILSPVAHPVFYDSQFLYTFGN